jgi:hypothetical protein
VRRKLSAAALVVALAGTATAQVAVLQIQILEGEGGVHAPGARLARPLTLAVTDETGRPVPGAAVSFNLPEDGPSGAFASGLRTDVAATDQLGRATLRSIQLNRISGRFQIRIIASKEQARAGTVSFQYIADAGSGVAAAGSATAHPAPRGHGKWIAIAALVGAGAAAGVVASRSGHSAPPSAAAVPTLTIGSPSLTVGKP